MDPLSVFMALLVGHAVCDYPLQGDFLARGKNHKSPIPGVPWLQCLLAHAVIHGGAVALVTRDPSFGVFEFCLHALIDYGKCDGWYGFNTDQLLHVASKLLFAALVVVR